MYRFLLTLLLLLYSYVHSATALPRDAGGEKGESEEVDGSDSEKEPDEIPHLSAVGWNAYSGLGAEPPVGTPIASVEILKDHIKKYLYYEGRRTEACKGLAEDRRAWLGTNTVVVHVFYQDPTGQLHHHKIPHVFISGWDYTNKGFETRGDLKIISAVFEAPITPVWLGDFYMLPDGRTIGNAPVETIIRPGGHTLISDYDARGLNISPRMDKRTRKMVNKKFSVSTYGHSEEAFISYLQNGGDTIISPDIVPQGVMFLVISTNAPCGICNSVLTNLVSGLDFKRNVLRAMFPKITVENIPLSIVYGAVDEFGKTRAPKDRDLIDSIDSLQTITYILSMKT